MCVCEQRIHRDLTASETGREGMCRERSARDGLSAGQMIAGSSFVGRREVGGLLAVGRRGVGGLLAVGRRGVKGLLAVGRRVVGCLLPLFSCEAWRRHHQW